MSIETSPHLESYRRMEIGEPYEPAAFYAPYFPSFAYREFQRTQPRTRERPYYASMAITSGGYKRDAGMNIGSVIAKNTEYGEHLRNYLADNNLGPTDVIIPSELGSMKQASWGQLDFLMLWYHIMAGVHEDDAHRIQDHLRHEGVYSDGKWAQADLLGATDDDKWNAYVRFTDGYSKALDNYPVRKYNYYPVKGVIGVLDGEMSLGGRAEKLFARLLGAPFYTLEAQEASVSEAFRSELDTLNDLGARALQLFPEEGPRLIFRPDFQT